MLKRLLFLPIIIIFAVLAVRLWTHYRADGDVRDDLEQIPKRKVAIVFGAGVFNNLPSPVLYDRILAGAELYKAGKVSKLLMSGDNRLLGYNEPEVMRRTALQMGIPDADIALDYAGRSTYETCYRAHDIFDLSEAILVTQRFHLDRAMMICEQFGIDAVGFVADRRPYRGMWFNHLREALATIKAIWEVFITRPLPVMGEKIKI